MRDDLLDAQAAVDWALAQIPRLQENIASWFDGQPYRLVEEPHPEIGKTLLKLRDVKRAPPIINAEVGAIINNIRSSLDLTAAALAVRNAKTPNADRHFPIFRSQQDFIDPVEGIDGRKYRSWLSDGERAIIKGLKPYPTGHDALIALHKLDVMRKHHRLIGVRLIPSSIIVTPIAMGAGLEFPAAFPGFKDDAVIAWFRFGAPHGGFVMPLQITFDEIELVPPRPVVPALQELATEAISIINKFDLP